MILLKQRKEAALRIQKALISSVISCKDGKIMRKAAATLA